MLLSQSLLQGAVRREPEILTSSALKPPRQILIGCHVSQALCPKCAPDPHNCSVGRHDGPHFTEEGTEAQSGEVNWCGPSASGCSPVTAPLTVYSLRPGRAPQEPAPNPNPGVAMGFQAWSLHLRQGGGAPCSPLQPSA